MAFNQYDSLFDWVDRTISDLDFGRLNTQQNELEHRLKIIEAKVELAAKELALVPSGHIQKLAMAMRTLEKKAVAYGQYNDVSVGKPRHQTVLQPPPCEPQEWPEEKPRDAPCAWGWEE